MGQHLKTSKTEVFTTAFRSHVKLNLIFSKKMDFFTFLKSEILKLLKFWIFLKLWIIEYFEILFFF